MEVDTAGTLEMMRKHAAADRDEGSPWASGDPAKWQFSAATRDRVREVIVAFRDGYDAEVTEHEQEMDRYYGEGSGARSTQRAISDRLLGIERGFRGGDMQRSTALNDGIEPLFSAARHNKDGTTDLV